MSLTRITTHLKAAAIAGLLISAMQPALAYNLKGAICNKGSDSSITLVNQDGKSIIELSTGSGRSQSMVGLAIQGLDKNPIITKDLDVKSPITAVFEIRDKKLLKYSRTLVFKISLRNADGKLVIPTVGCDDRVNTVLVPLRPVGGDTWSATFPSKIIVDLGKEVPRLKIGENSPVVACVIYLDAGAFGFDETNKSVLVDSISVAGQKLPVKLENTLGCEAYPTSVFNP